MWDSVERVWVLCVLSVGQCGAGVGIVWLRVGQFGAGLGSECAAGGFVVCVGIVWLLVEGNKYLLF